MKEFYEIDNEKEYKISVGENAQENWELLKKSNQSDVFMHLNNLSSPYVIIHNSNPPKCILNLGAKYCVSYSKWSELRDVNVLYTSVKNVKFGDKVGEVIISKKYNLI